ncbi:excinuclease ABC subunit UvrC [Inmirania thermothiophila]|uniref:UvrABC system protein C n=1 Tax=Inmirania thermothiophila TaxID=1750597 RepID=A0A3N1Y005_9GAMM|nr:excinuclease ABC subunit UvrC [Inmirania thermothiophila]ROR32184.1 excinuclease ABC subunit C [Inmirania thermothiophila]
MGEQEPFDLEAFLRGLTRRPGVYRFLDAEGRVLYVGKARSLRNRVTSYFRGGVHDRRRQLLLARMRRIEVTVTRTEAEALILENELIKHHRPRFNVLLRDDKSYPYIHLSDHPRYPRLSFYRGPRRRDGRYFGPYPSAAAVRESLQLLQRLFRVRQCEDGFFRNRTRPCLQHQIGRCSAPCVGLISPEDYARDVAHTVMVLEGRDAEVVEALGRRMEAAAERLDFEEAARLRDLIRALQQVRGRQYVATGGGDLDVVACHVEGGAACVELLAVRGGRVLGSRSHFPRLPEGGAGEEVLAAFLAQHYLGRPAPPEIVVARRPPGCEALEEALGGAVRIRSGVRGVRRRWLEMAEANAREALRARVSSRAGLAARLAALEEALELEGPLQRIECFDISHTAGEAAVAACVVFDREGARSADYRRYNLRGIAPGDDYAAIRQAVARRYRRLSEEGAPLPDLVLIDGGRGQLAAAVEALRELQVEGPVLVGVAKGPERRPGEERLFLVGREAPLILPATSPALHLVQSVRDEAHRFAVTGHRRRRARSRQVSVLEAIPGVGPERRRRLLRTFGGLREVARAGVEELARVPGIDRVLARRIYEALHGDEEPCAPR